MKNTVAAAATNKTLATTIFFMALPLDQGKRDLVRLGKISEGKPPPNAGVTMNRRWDRLEVDWLRGMARTPMAAMSSQVTASRSFLFALMRELEKEPWLERSCPPPDASRLATAPADAIE
jgi:hypothetical protein